jgi:hypothetical protein
VVSLVGVGLVFGLLAWQSQPDWRSHAQPPSGRPAPSSQLRPRPQLQPFPPPLSPVIPGDINPQRVNSLTNAGRFAQVQRIFDIFAWQTFIALNWPANADGTPDDSKMIGQPSDHGVVWEHWKHEFDVYTPNGEPPQDTTGPRPHSLRGTGATVPDIFNETLQAFAGPLVDQNGNFAHYEIRLSEPEVNYVVENNLYYIQGQVEFSQQGNTVAFPRGKFQGPSGAIELKAAWKQLDPQQDIEKRFFTAVGDIVIDDPAIFSKKVDKKDVKLGLVGLHIAAKTDFATQWIWATFEHVDNLQTPSLMIDGKPLKPSFNNPDCEICPVNQQPPFNAVIPVPPGSPPKQGQQFNGWDPTAQYEPTQVSRLIPIPDDKQDLNRQVQFLLRNAVPGNVWQYYELIDTQWPTDPSAPPTPPTPFDPQANPNSITNKSGGVPTPVYLTNSTMETYFQAGNQQALNQIQGFPPIATQLVFGTESCVGCHSSAGIATAYDPIKGATFGPQLSADFSWLLQQKAKPRVE